MALGQKRNKLVVPEAYKAMEQFKMKLQKKLEFKLLLMATGVTTPREIVVPSVVIW
jgi:hypothetical protein